MDRIDALGARPERRQAWSRALLVEAEDAELQEIVERAARELSSPMATVTLVLDHIQLFKAHVGLPPVLAASRGTHRDASFCQFVVRDGQAFEVCDAPNDPRVPQELVKEYGLRAYLGVPIRTGETVLGSLCVLDTRERSFTAVERQSLEKLAERVDARLLALCEDRSRVRLALADQASQPGIAELRESLSSILGLAGSGLPAMAAIRSFLALSEHALDHESVSREALRGGLQAALQALEASENVLYDIEASAADCDDCVHALEQLATPDASARLSEVVTAAQDLARSATRSIGGAPLPDLDFDPRLRASRPMSIALLSRALTSLADAIADDGSNAGIRIRVRDLGATAELVLSAEALSDQDAEAVAEELGSHLGDYPLIAVHPLGGALRLAFRVVQVPADG